jgi:hypothetical protein
MSRWQWVSENRLIKTLLAYIQQWNENPKNGFLQSPPTTDTYGEVFCGGRRERRGNKKRVIDWDEAVVA